MKAKIETLNALEEAHDHIGRVTRLKDACKDCKATWFLMFCGRDEMGRCFSEQVQVSEQIFNGAANGQILYLENKIAILESELSKQLSA